LTKRARYPGKPGKTFLTYGEEGKPSKKKSSAAQQAPSREDYLEERAYSAAEGPEFRI
jgi:hypothetical protein